MNILLALLVGVLSYFVAHLVFNEVISMLIGLIAGLSVLYGDRFIGRGA